MEEEKKNMKQKLSVVYSNCIVVWNSNGLGHIIILTIVVMGYLLQTSLWYKGLRKEWLDVFTALQHR